MTLVRTNDGMMGWNIAGRVVWCSSVSELKNWGLIEGGFNRFEFKEFCREIDRALEELSRSGDTHVEFGVCGSAMYSFKEDQDAF